MKTNHSRVKEPRRLQLAAEQMTQLPEAEYRRPASRAGLGPPLPRPNKEGNYPADQTLAVLVARDICRRRHAVGLSQAQLAKRAGIRASMLDRIEQGKHAPAVAIVERIDKALARAEAKNGQ